MTTVKDARPPAASGRASSLTRMLQLEKQYKMLRIQDRRSSSTPPPHPEPAQAPTPAPAPISTKLPTSVLPNSALGARHTSEGPPASSPSEEPIMKASRRNTALPSLSLSIPPSPTAALTVEDRPSAEVIRQVEKAEAPPDESRERIKTVTFSDPDDADDKSSDESSICQSPTWEEFGQSSKKKAKKRESAQKKKEKKKLDEQADKTTKKPKRLSKLPPNASSAIAPLKATDRSLSAPELDQHHKAVHGDLGRSTADSVVKNTASQQKPMDEGAKPKSRGFLANFRSSSSGPGKMASPRVSNDIQSLKGWDATGHQAQATLSRSGEGGDFTNPRPAPSVRSNMSATTLSGLSGEKRPTHGRSMSLLARLKGPSYLYHQNPEVAKEEHKYPPISQPVLPGMQQSPPWQNAQRPGVTLATPPRAEKSAPQESRGRPSEANIQHSRDPSSEYEHTGITEPIVCQVKSVGRGVPVANEGRRRPQSYVAQVRHRYDDINSPTLTGPVSDEPQTRVPDRASDHQIQILSASKVDQANLQKVQNEMDQEPQSPLSDRSYASQYQDEVDQLSVSHSPFMDDEKLVAGARGRVSHTSERQTNRSGGMSPRGALPTNQNRKAASYEQEKESEKANRAHKMMTKGEHEPFEQPQSTHTNPQLLEQDRSAGYFAFISESYTAPSLELHSHAGSRHQSSPKIEQLSSPGDDSVPWDLACGEQGESSKGRLSGQVPVLVEPEGAPKSHGPVDRAKGSPATSDHHSDNDMSPLEPLAAPSIQLKIESKSNASVQADEDQPSGNTSERSSSSTCGDGPRMTSAITTPNSSRPHSSRGYSPMDLPSKSSRAKPASYTDEEMGRKAHRATYTGPTDGRLASHPMVKGVDTHDDHWNRAAMPIDMDNDKGTSLQPIRAEAHASSPSLVGTPTSGAFPHEVKGEMEEEASAAGRQRPNLPPKAHSAVDLPATSFLPPLKHQPLNPRRATLGVAANSVQSSPPPEFPPEAKAPRPFAPKAPRANSASSQDATGTVSAGAAYLKEARRSAPPSSRALRPGYSPKNSHQASSSSRGALGSPEPPKGGEPLAKMLVQCCNCQFFHDMPARVYECMAKPDSVVEDKLLGVSAAITTTVKCPWCAHGMTTQCCAGYAAILFLKEKLHGK